MSLYLHALGHFHPENEITNAFLEELDIGTNEEWILERVGIRSRRTTLPLDYIRKTQNRDPRAAAEATLYTHAETGRRAAEMALERAGIEKSAIGMVDRGLLGDGHRDARRGLQRRARARARGARVRRELRVHELLREPLRPLADGPGEAAGLRPGRGARGDDPRRRLRGSRSAVLWGDGTVAAVLSTRIPGRAEVLDSTLQSSPAGADKVVVPRAGHFRQQGRAVQMFAIRKTAEQLVKLRDAHACEDRRFHFVGHQANLRMLEAVRRECDIPEERHHTTSSGTAIPRARRRRRCCRCTGTTGRPTTTSRS